MTKNEILEKAIEKAVKNGWNCPYLKDKHFLKVIKVHYESIIFDRSFALSFWGDEYVDDRFGETQDVWIERTGSETNWGCHKLRWQFHIQKLAIIIDRIEYIKRFL